jgi:nucleoside-diphosphate-sugar epimerase
MTGEQQRRILVAGATGFIGSHLTRELLRTGFRVRVASRDPGAFQGVDGVECAACDLTRRESLAGIGAGVDAVVTCAGLLGRWGTSPEALWRANAEGPVSLLERTAGEGVGRFVHLSAGGVTGPLPRGAVADERSACRPATDYEKSKREGERRVLAFSRRSGFPALVVRPTFTYGPGDPHKAGLFRAVRDGRFAFVGPPDSRLHPVFIDDLIAGVLLALDAGRAGETYILGGPRPVTKRELVHAIADELGVTRPWIVVPRWLAWPAAVALERTSRTFGFEPLLTRSRIMMMADEFGYSIGKARDELGYRPTTGLAAGVRMAVRDYRERGIL